MEHEHVKSTRVFEWAFLPRTRAGVERLNLIRLLSLTVECLGYISFFLFFFLGASHQVCRWNWARVLLVSVSVSVLRSVYRPSSPSFSLLRSCTERGSSLAPFSARPTLPRSVSGGKRGDWSQSTVYIAREFKSGDKPLTLVHTYGTSTRMFIRVRWAEGWYLCLVSMLASYVWIKTYYCCYFFLFLTVVEYFSVI